MEKRKSRLRVLHGIILLNAFFVMSSGAIILTSMWINAEKSVRELSESLKSEIQSSVVNQTINYFTPAKGSNQNLAFMLYNYFDDPVNNSNSRETMYGYYKELMKTYSQFKMIYFADTSGNLVMLNRMTDNSFSKRAVRNNGMEIHVTWEHENQVWLGSYFNTTDIVGTGYDPRMRSWYTSAQKERSAIWTSVYLFATDNLPGFTCAVPIFDQNGSLLGVSSIDIAVDELSRFLGTIQPTPGTKIFIVDKQNNLVALQAVTESDLEKLFVRSTNNQGNVIYNVSSVSELQDGEIRSLLENLLERNSQSGYIKYQNKNYMSSLLPIPVGDGLDLYLCVITPEDDIVGDVRRNLKKVTVFSICILIFVLIISGFFSQSIARPLRILSEEMMKIKSFQLDSNVSIRTGLTEIIDIRDSFESMRSGLKNFKRYVPSELVAQLINQNISADLGGEQHELTVFFSDIAKFTSISEKMDPEKLVNDLCVYFEIISKTIIDKKGTIDKYIGDAVMAFWGAPQQLKNHAESACHAAIHVRNSLHTLMRQWENQGKMPFNTRIGIHTGNVIVGNMGYTERLNYTVIGDAVNVSSRLEGINKVYGTEITVSENTYKKCKDGFEFRQLDRVSLLGRYEGLNIYELISFKDDINKSLRKIYQYYETGLKHYFDQNWTEAIKYFSAVIKNLPSDIPAKLMRERCLQFQKKPPSSEWNGVYAQSYK